VAKSAHEDQQRITRTQMDVQAEAKDLREISKSRVKKRFFSLLPGDQEALAGPYGSHGDGLFLVFTSMISCPLRPNARRNFSLHIRSLTSLVRSIAAESTGEFSLNPIATIKEYFNDDIGQISLELKIPFSCYWRGLCISDCHQHSFPPRSNHDQEGFLRCPRPNSVKRGFRLSPR